MSFVYFFELVHKSADFKKVEVVVEVLEEEAEEASEVEVVVEVAVEEVVALKEFENLKVRK